MEKTLSTIIKELIAAIWRRRALLLMPLLVLLPLSILGAKYLPKTYIATALMVMQESNRDNPFAKASGVDYTLVKRVEGMEAWLKSEHVMTEILRPFSDVDPASQPGLFLLEIKEMRDAFKLELVGSDFLRFSLQDSNPNGLGKKLEAITSKFLEGLLIPDKSVQSASQAVLQHHQDQLRNIRKQQDQLKQTYRDTKRQLAGRKSTAELQRQRQRLQQLQTLEASNNRQLTSLRSQNAEPRGDASVKVASAGNEVPLDKQARIAQLQQKQRQIAQAIVTLKAKLSTQSAASTELGELEKQWLQLGKQEKAAKQRFNQAAQRLTGVNVENPLGIFNAPEGIKIIDAPKDPARPATSGLKILVAGIVGALFLGISLAVLAEITDQRIFTREEFAKLSGTRIIGRLPKSDRSTDPASLKTG